MRVCVCVSATAIKCLIFVLVIICRSEFAIYIFISLCPLLLATFVLYLNSVVVVVFSVSGVCPALILQAPRKEKKKTDFRSQHTFEMCMYWSLAAAALPHNRMQMHTPVQMCAAGLFESSFSCRMSFGCCAPPLRTFSVLLLLFLWALFIFRALCASLCVSACLMYLCRCVRVYIFSLIYAFEQLQDKQRTSACNGIHVCMCVCMSGQ